MNFNEINIHTKISRQGQTVYVVSLYLFIEDNHSNLAKVIREMCVCVCGGGGVFRSTLKSLYVSHSIKAHSFHVFFKPVY